MTKLIISGSAKFQDEYQKLLAELSPEFEIIDYPKAIPYAQINEKYPVVFSNFFAKIEKADVFLLANFDKPNLAGSIGAAAFSELSYAIVRKINHDQKIDIFLLQAPPKEFFAKDEVSLWLENSWVKIWLK